MNYKNYKLTRFLSTAVLGAVAIIGNANAVASSSETVTTSDRAITLEKIMSDPSWIGNTPKGAKWLPDSRHITYTQNVANSAIDKVVRLDTQAGSDKTKAAQVGLDALHTVKLTQTVYNDTHAAYVFNGDIFVTNLRSNKTRQITFTSAKESSPQWLLDGSLGYWQRQTFFTVDLDSNVTKELFNVVMAEAPTAPEGPKDIIAKEQHQLIGYVAKEFAKKQERFSHAQELKEQNQAANKPTFYFGKGQLLRTAKVSPKGDKVLVVTAPKTQRRGENDLMPNYIGQDGRIQFEKVRRRVADAKPVQQSFFVVDLITKEVKELAISDLPDFDKDVLASVKAENAEALGKTYESKPSPRHINLIVDWTWDQSAVQWHPKGNQVAIMLEAWDNKDRWLATVDFKKNKFLTQHQLHDDAWINYTFNDFGWFPNSEKLYYLSEESGYSHLYTKQLKDKRAKQLTKGEFEVSQVKLDKQGKSFFFRANVNHPGEYHIYRLSSEAKKEGAPSPLTSELIGDNNYKLSPDESKLLISHSSLLRPTELYLVDLSSKHTTKLTDTVSAEFKAMPFKAPKIIAVPSSHTDKPIYARLYLPENYKEGEARRAVIFNHGAGYLQNSHKGWSGYFREFMFHNMLAEQGYVVLDMDYRASKGYGRDWRTAIYRQMGTPETQDLVDGVDWLVNNANVDRERVGTYGGSYGGFMTFMALFTEPDLFQAGAALRPVTDWAHYNDGYTSNILNRPEDDMIAYRRSSPIYFAEGLSKPLLINAPMIDDNVFFVDVVRLVQRMIELEKEDFETAIYPVEPHGFREPSSWLDEYRRIYKLFEENL